jgi:tellurite resistance protein TerC
MGPRCAVLRGIHRRESLSLDNLFLFVIIMSTFAVPLEQQGRVLMIGIVVALMLRAACIALGALLEAFSSGSQRVI